MVFPEPLPTSAIRFLRVLCVSNKLSCSENLLAYIRLSPLVPCDTFILFFFIFYLLISFPSSGHPICLPYSFTFLFIYYSIYLFSISGIVYDPYMCFNIFHCLISLLASGISFFIYRIYIFFSFRFLLLTSHLSFFFVSSFSCHFFSYPISPYLVIFISLYQYFVFMNISCPLFTFLSPYMLRFLFLPILHPLFSLDACPVLV